MYFYNLYRIFSIFICCYFILIYQIFGSPYFLNKGELKGILSYEFSDSSYVRNLMEEKDSWLDRIHENRDLISQDLPVHKIIEADKAMILAEKYFSAFPNRYDLLKLNHLIEYGLNDSIQLGANISIAKQVNYLRSDISILNIAPSIKYKLYFNNIKGALLYRAFLNSDYGYSGSEFLVSYGYNINKYKTCLFNYYNFSIIPNIEYKFTIHSGIEYKSNIKALLVRDYIYDFNDLSLQFINTEALVGKIFNINNQDLFFFISSFVSRAQLSPRPVMVVMNFKVGLQYQL